MLFWSKTAEHAAGRWAGKSPVMKWANAVKESPKTIHSRRIQPHTLSHLAVIKMLSGSMILSALACLA